MKSISAKQLDNKVDLITFDLPAIKNDEVLVSVLETGICSTDRELLIGGTIVPPEGFDFLVLGHEAVGKVVEVGSDVSLFQPGDLVVPTVRRGCGKCSFCNTGRSDMCNTGNYKERGILGLHGFMSEHFIENEANLIKISDDIRRHAVLLEPLSVGVKAVEESFAIQKTRLYGQSDEVMKDVFKNALIIGAGPIGLLASLIMLYHNVKVLCADIEEYGGIKSILIEKMGGRYINIKEYHKDHGIDLEGMRLAGSMEEVDIIVDASSDPLTCFQLVDFLAPNGFITILGLPHKNGVQKVNSGKLMSFFVMKNHIALGSVNSNKMHFEKAGSYIEVLQKKYDDILSQIVTHRLPFTDYRQAFNITGKDRAKVVLTWERYNGAKH